MAPLAFGLHFVLQAAKENHPDKLGTVDIIDDGVKGLKFIEVKEAYEVLSDVDRRREYDTMHQGYQRKDNVRSRWVLRVVVLCSRV